MGMPDTYVPTEMGYRLYEACTAAKRLMIARGAIHANSYLTDPAAYEAAVSAFAGQPEFLSCMAQAAHSCLPWGETKAGERA